MSFGKFIFNSAFAGTIDLIHLKKKLVKGSKLPPHQPFFGVVEEFFGLLVSVCTCCRGTERVKTLSRKCVCVQWELYFLLCLFPGQLLVLAPEKSIFQHKTIKGHGIIVCSGSNNDASPKVTAKKYARVYVLVSPISLE